MSVLTFEVGNERFGIDVCRVEEVLPRLRLQRSAGLPAHIAGLFVYRGRPVPVIDLHRLLGAGDCPPHLSSRMILLPLNGGAGWIGLLAARVANLVELPEKPLASGYVAHGGGLLRLVDIDQWIASAGGFEALARLTA